MSGDGLAEVGRLQKPGPVGPCGPEENAGLYSQCIGKPSEARCDMPCAWDGSWMGSNRSRKMRRVALVHTRCVAQTKVGVVKLERRDIF